MILRWPDAGDLGHDQVAAVALHHLRRERRRGTTGEGGDEGDLITSGKGRGFPIERLDLDPVDVDTDVRGQLSGGVAHLRGEPGELFVEVVHDLTQIRPSRVDAHAVADEVAEGGGDVDVDDHRLSLVGARVLARPPRALGWLSAGVGRRVRGRH